MRSGPVAPLGLRAPATTGVSHGCGVGWATNAPAPEGVPFSSVVPPAALPGGSWPPFRDPSSSWSCP